MGTLGAVASVNLGAGAKSAVASGGQSASKNMLTTNSEKTMVQAFLLHSECLVRRSLSNRWPPAYFRACLELAKGMLEDFKVQDFARPF